MLKRIACSALFWAVLASAANAYVPTYAHLSVYRNDEERFAASIENFQVRALTAEPVLYAGTECAALGPNGEVAIFSGPAPDEGYEKVLGVYDGNGAFQYAYELQIDSEGRAYSVFFTEDSHSLFLFSPYTVYEFGANGEGIISSYDVRSVPGILGDYWPVRGFNAAYISPQSQYRFEEFTGGKLSIVNPEGQTIGIYDHSAQYRRWLLMECAPFFCMAALAVFFGIVYWRAGRRTKSD